MKNSASELVDQIPFRKGTLSSFYGSGNTKTLIDTAVNFYGNNILHITFEDSLEVLIEQYKRSGLKVDTYYSESILRLVSQYRTVMIVKPNNNELIYLKYLIAKIFTTKFDVLIIDSIDYYTSNAMFEKDSNCKFPYNFATSFSLKTIIDFIREYNLIGLVSTSYDGLRLKEFSDNVITVEEPGMFNVLKCRTSNGRYPKKIYSTDQYIKRLEKENVQLKSELETYKQKTISFINTL